MSDLRTCLWFDGAAEEAARLHAGLLPGSEIEGITPGPDGRALIVSVRLGGVPYTYLNGGPQYRLSPAASIQVFTDDQEETDRLWEALTQGGEESMCGWCTDRYGVSWQVIPKDLPAYIGGEDAKGAAKATEAMLEMRKIDIAVLKAAYEEGKEAT